MSSQLKVGDVVVLAVPENPKLDGAPAKVEAVTDWGAHVSTPASATGAFRAVYDELRRPDGSPIVPPSEDVGEAYGADKRDSGASGAGKVVEVRENGGVRPAVSSSQGAKRKAVARESGYTGDVCDTCGSPKMRRNGACLLCESCGATSGCS